MKCLFQTMSFPLTNDCVSNLSLLERLTFSKSSAHVRIIISIFLMHPASVFGCAKKEYTESK